LLQDAEWDWIAIYRESQASLLSRSCSPLDGTQGHPSASSEQIDDLELGSDYRRKWLGASEELGVDAVPLIYIGGGFRLILRQVGTPHSRQRQQNRIQVGGDGHTTPGWNGVPPVRRRIMRANRRRDTGPELAIRSELHRLGFRFRVDLPIRVDGNRPIRPDIVFSKAKVAVFVDGCFWHGCPEHGTLPATTNREYWATKIGENRARDERNRRILEVDGWTVIRAWEHDEPAAVAADVAKAVIANRAV
jgi:DNA mismatch endonuclease (patch repair protein)